MGKLCENDLQNIVKLYKEGKTMREISEVLGNCNYSTVNRALKKCGVEIRKKGSKPGSKYRSNQRNKQCVPDCAVEEMLRMYENNVPIVQIAKKFNVGRRAVERKVKETGVERTKSMKSRNFYDSENDSEYIKLYNNGLSTTEISKKFGVSHRTVRIHLIHNGVKLRTISESLFNHNLKRFPKELQDFETLYDLYVSRRLSKKDIAENFNVSPNVIDRCLKNFGIHVRGSSEAKIGMFSGEKHPNWKGGRSGLYMRLREYFRCFQVKEVIKRDGKRCQMCGGTHQLQVHHIRPFKDIFNEILLENNGKDVVKDQEELYNIMRNDGRMNDLDNLITYCKSCHYKIHGYKTE